MTIEGLHGGGAFGAPVAGAFVSTLPPHVTDDRVASTGLSARVTDGRVATTALLARWELAKLHPLNFLRWFVWTCDQHDPVSPIKPFPWNKPYIKQLVSLWHDEPLLVVVKSRQMLMTWLFAALYLWDTVMHQGRLTVFQSKRLEDAVGNEAVGDGPLGRLKFILHHMPGLGMLLPQYNREKHTTMARVEFPWLNSAVLAIPQGGAIIRQRTVSGIFADENAFQPEASDAYVAARPCIRGGGRYTIVTTADLGDGGHTRALYQDKLGGGGA